MQYSQKYDCRHLSRHRSVPVAALLLACIAGCEMVHELPPMPFTDQNRTSYVTPSEHIEQLRKLGNSAGGMTEEEKKSTIVLLTNQIKSEEDALVREQILHTLAKFDGPTALAVLQAGTKDPDPEVRITACQLLSKNKGMPAIKTLAEVLGSDSNIDVRLAASKSLKNYPQREAVAAMQVALEDRNPALQRSAVISLKEMTGKDLGNDVNRWRQYVQSGQIPDRTSPSIAERFFNLF